MLTSFAHSGRVLHGRSVVRLIEESPVNGDAPTEEILIADCGELAEGEDGVMADEFADGHEEYPSDDVRSSLLQLAKTSADWMMSCRRAISTT